MTSRNLFLLGRNPGFEDQLTEMLVWLISAVPEVGGVVVQLAFGDLDVDTAQLQATTQHKIAAGRLDALLRTKSLVLVVESKLGSFYGEGQLRAYTDWLAVEHKDVAHKALMTLTANPGQWSVEDLAHAAEIDVVAVPRRWHELYTALSTLTSSLDELPGRLVQEFLDMLSAEGLIPVAPLEGDELVDSWARSRDVIERYHAYFRACTEAIGEALQAPSAPRPAAQPGYIYLEFRGDEGQNFLVGLEDSDRSLGIPAKLHRDAPIVWFAAKTPDGSAVAKLEASPPEGWRIGPRFYGDASWPRAWRYLDEVIGIGSFPEQQSALAAACAQAREWLVTANTPSPADPGLTNPGQPIATDPDPH